MVWLDLDMQIEQQPITGDQFTMEKREAMVVGDNALLVSLTPQTFIRGGEGTAMITIENTSEVTTEIITALQHGNTASPDIQLILEDTDGNRLSTQAMQQFTGDVIAVGEGKTIARLAPGARFTSEPMTISVPEAAPDELILRLSIDHFYYNVAKDTEVKNCRCRDSSKCLFD